MSSPLKLTDDFIPVSLANTSLMKLSGHFSFQRCSILLSCSQCQKLLWNQQISCRGAYSVQCISLVFVTRRRSCLWFQGLCRTHIVPQVGCSPQGFIVFWAVCRPTLSWYGEKWDPVVIPATLSVYLLKDGG